MKSRLLAVLLSVSMLFGSIPVNAAELGAGTNFESTAVSVQEETADEFDNVVEETTPPEEAGPSDEDLVQDDADIDGEDSTASDTVGDDSVKADNTDDENNSDTPDNENDTDSDSGDNNSGETAEGENTDSEKSEADIDEDTASEEQTENDSLVDEAAEEAFNIMNDEGELKYGETNRLTLPEPVYNPGSDDYGDYYEDVYNWYSFKAPEAGYYNFHITPVSGTSYAIELFDSYDGEMIRFIDGYKNLHTNYMDAEETVYILAYTDTAGDVEVDLDVQKLTSYNDADNKDDGSYVFDTTDYTLSILPKNGPSSCYISVSMEAKDNAQLAEAYRLVAYAEDTSDSWIYSYDYAYLSESDNYKASTRLNTISGEEYNLHFVMLDNNDDILAIFDPGIQFTANINAESVVIYDIIPAETGVTFVMESIKELYCSYGEVSDGPVEETKTYVYIGANKMFTINDLSPDTEYFFRFTDYFGYTMYATQYARTTSLITDVEYTVGLKHYDTADDTLIITAEVSGYTGNSAQARLYYEYTDSFGLTNSSYHSYYLTDDNVEIDDNNAKSFTIVLENFLYVMPLEVDRTYDFTVWIEFSDDFNDYYGVKYAMPKVIKDLYVPLPKDISVYDFDADDIEFELTPDPENPTKVDYRVKINGIEEGYFPDSIYQYIYYKPIDSKQYHRGNGFCILNGRDPEAESSVSDLKLGLEYEFVTLVGGVRKEADHTITTGTTNVELEKIGEDTINAFDFVRKFKVKSIGEGVTLADNYSLNLSCINADTGKTLNLGDFKFSPEDENQTEMEIEIATAKAQYPQLLDPDTEYDLIWELYDKEAPDYTDRAIYTLYDSITTAEKAVKVETTQGSYRAQELRVTLDTDISNYDNFETLRLYAHIRESNSQVYRGTFNYSVDLSAENGYSDTTAFDGLEPETEYVVSVRNGSSINSVEYGNFTFTTLPDERAFTTSISQSAYSVELNYSITGVTPYTEGFIYCYISEDNGDGSDVWELVGGEHGYKSWKGEASSKFNIVSYNGSQLRKDTKYKYKVGLSHTYEASINELEKVYEDSFIFKGADDDGGNTGGNTGGGDETGNGDVITGDIPATGIPEGLWIAGISASGYDYTGSAIKPEIRVYNHKTLLHEKTDYTVAYKNNTKVFETAKNSDMTKAPSITVTGKGNYSGKEVVNFSILPLDISENNVSDNANVFEADDMSIAYNKKEQKPVPELLWNGKKLKNKTDYTVEYYDSMEQKVDSVKDAAEYTIKLTGTGNFTGTRTINLSVIDTANLKLMSKVSVSKIPNQPYNGNAIIPAITVKNGKDTLTVNEHYTLSYSNNTEIGTAYVIITGKVDGGYSGTKRVSFKITGTPISKAKVNGLSGQTFTYNGGTIEPTLTLSVNGQEQPLTPGTDYNVEFQNNLNAGTATALITGLGAYTGTVKKTFKIKAYDVAKNEGGPFIATFENNSNSVPYAKGGAKPNLRVIFFKNDNTTQTLVEGTDYTLTYKNNNAVTTESTTKLPTVIVKGKGNFTGTYTGTLNYTITAQNLNNMTLTAQDKTYQNKKNIYSTKVTITDVDGKVLKAGTDYKKELEYYYKPESTSGTVTLQEVTKDDIIPVGTEIMVFAYAVESTDKKPANYTGICTGEYRITEASISGAKITIPDQDYTGKAITLNKSQITSVKVKGEELNSDQYEIVEGSYKNNIKKGTASVTIKGLGKYGGTVTAKFKIKAKSF
ncbi:MAG: hypothetical protein J1E98_08185 [Lachnospiraceae bacterium]|nr:hypothetical protein [Lachnospiraceae bacterium]